MAGGYKATLEVQCWKEHTCCYCGAAYRYLLRKKQTGHGPTQTDAAAAARSSAVRAFRSTLEFRPCPGCGNYQPDMIGASRLSRHAILLLLTVAVLAGVFLLGVLELVPPAVTLVLLVLFAGPILLINTWIGMSNPNRNLRANKALAERLVNQNKQQAVPTDTNREDRPRAVVIDTGVGYWLAFLFLGATVVLMPGAELVRLAGGWRSNPDWHPAFIGPGDTAWTWVHLDQPIESLRGEWRATGSGKILNGNAIGLQQMTIDLPSVTSRDVALPDIQKLAGSASVPIQLWARVTLPPHRQIEKQPTPAQLKLILKVTVLVADAKDDGKVVEKHIEVPYPVEVKLASARAGFQYGFYWYVAMLGGGSMFLLAGVYHLLRDQALKQCGLPTRVVPVSDEESREPVPVAPSQEDAPKAKPEEAEKTETSHES
jgi:hypothetical protein